MFTGNTKWAHSTLFLCFISIVIYDIYQDDLS